MVTLLVILAIIVLARLIVDWGFADGLFALFCPPLPVVLRYGESCEHNTTSIQCRLLTINRSLVF